MVGIPEFELLGGIKDKMSRKPEWMRCEVGRVVIAISTDQLGYWRGRTADGGLDRGRRGS